MDRAGAEFVARGAGLCSAGLNGNRALFSDHRTDLFTGSVFGAGDSWGNNPYPRRADSPPIN